jgi:hypothetical protein
VGVGVGVGVVVDDEAEDDVVELELELLEAADLVEVLLADFVEFAAAVVAVLAAEVAAGVVLAAGVAALSELAAAFSLVTVSAEAAVIGSPNFAVATRIPIPAKPTKVLVAVLTRQTPLREFGWLVCQRGKEISQLRESRGQGRRCKHQTLKCVDSFQ